MAIPTFEFFSFPFIRFNEPLSHLWTFKYIVKDEEFKPEYKDKTNKFLNRFLILIELFYLISFVLGIFSNYLDLIDIFNLFILIIIYIYYLTIFFSYFLIIIILFVKKCKNDKSINEKGLPEINLLSYFIDPSEKENRISIKKNKTHFYYILLLLEIIFFIILIFYYGYYRRKYIKDLFELFIYFFGVGFFL